MDNVGVKSATELNPASIPLVTLDNNALVALAEREPDELAVRELLQMHVQRLIVINVTLSTALEAQRTDKPKGWQQDFTAWLGEFGISKQNIFTGPRTIGFRTTDAPDAVTFSSDLETEFTQRVHAILFPNIPFQWRDFLARECERKNVSWAAMAEFAGAQLGFYIPPTPQSPQSQPTPTYDALSAGERDRVERLHARCHRIWSNAKNDALGFHNHLTQAFQTFHPERSVFVTSDKNFRKQTKMEALRSLGFTGQILPPREAVAFLHIVTGISLAN